LRGVEVAGQTSHKNGEDSESGISGTVVDLTTVESCETVCISSNPSQIAILLFSTPFFQIVNNFSEKPYYLLMV
jgi:hypothetical protein